MVQVPSIPGFRPVPRTGVIYVTHRAQEAGFTPADPAWANLGQGAPETGTLPGGSSRTCGIHLDADVDEYAPVGGLPALRQAVADLYNELYCRGHSSKYTADNVAISGGGRSALTRLAASLGDINMGHFIPDYTAYEELLNVFRSFHPIPIPLKEEDRYRLPAGQLQEHIQGLGLGALLLSNPCNPTGQVVAGDDLRDWVQTCRRNDCVCIVDEFYSHYVYGGGESSAASFVEDVDRDPVVIVDGLTKNWRHPGWRVCWTVGPRAVIDAVTSAGSFLDGGASHPLQAAAVPLLRADDVRRNRAVLQAHFSAKRDLVLGRLRGMGLRIDAEPQGGFYCWVNLSGLPPPLNDGMAFFEEGLRERVITVPGIFFDVNPGKRRSSSRYRNFCRLSFGPDRPTLERGLDAIARVLAKHR